jgi:hypothetical protein
MSSTTIYRCDVCHKTVDYQTLQNIDINYHNYRQGYHPSFNFDVCDECIGNVLYCFDIEWKPPIVKKKGKK